MRLRLRLRMLLLLAPPVPVAVAVAVATGNASAATDADLQAPARLSRLQLTSATTNRYPKSIADRSARSACRCCHAPLERSASRAATPRATTAGSASANPEQLARTAGSR